MMKVANNRTIGRERDSSDSHAGRSDMNEGRQNRHDARSVIAAIMLCAACWIALAFFFLF